MPNPRMYANPAEKMRVWRAKQKLKLQQVLVPPASLPSFVQGSGKTTIQDLLTKTVEELQQEFHLKGGELTKVLDLQAKYQQAMIVQREQDILKQNMDLIMEVINTVIKRHGLEGELREALRPYLSEDHARPWQG